MKPVDRHILNRLEPFAKAFVTDDQWLLVEKAVEDADGVLNTSGTVRDIIEKASFNSRSEAARYAAEQRWKGHKPTTRRYSGTAGKTEPTSTASEPASAPTTEADANAQWPKKKNGAVKDITEMLTLDELRAAAAATRREIADAEAKGRIPEGVLAGTYPAKTKLATIEKHLKLREEWHKRMPEYGIADLAAIIEKDFRLQGKKVPMAARPYLDAMGSLSSIKDNYYMDSGHSIVAYALSNLGSYKGETAKLVKAELKKRMASVTPTSTASSSGDRFYVGKPYEGDKGFAVGGEPYTGDKGFWV